MNADAGLALAPYGNEPTHRGRVPKPKAVIGKLEVSCPEGVDPASQLRHWHPLHTCVLSLCALTACVNRRNTATCLHANPCMICALKLSIKWPLKNQWESQLTAVRSMHLFVIYSLQACKLTGTVGTVRRHNEGLSFEKKAWSARISSKNAMHRLILALVVLVCLSPAASQDVVDQWWGMSGRSFADLSGNPSNATLLIAGEHLMQLCLDW